MISGRGRQGSIVLCMALMTQAVLLCIAGPAQASDVVIIGDTELKPVVEVVTGIRSTLRTSSSTHPMSSVRGKLKAVVQQEGASIVIALGKDALDEALRLPLSVAVIYGLVIVPPQTSRSNLTGVYMSTPSSEYVSLVRKHFPGLRKVSIVGSRTMLKILNGNGLSQVTAYPVSNSSELVNTLNRMDEYQAVVLLPDVSLLTTAVMEQIYLYSFRRNIPLLGISEGNVRHGSLFALVFDTIALGQQIGEMASTVSKGTSVASLPHTSPRTYNLYLSRTTARKMGIVIPDELLRRAKKIY